MEEEIFSTELRLRDREKFLLGRSTRRCGGWTTTPSTSARTAASRSASSASLARPVTTFCIDCKEEREKEEQSQAQQAGRSGAVSREDIGGNEEITGGTEE